MKYTISFEKEEYEKHIYDIKTRASNEGFWKSIDILYTILMSGEDKTLYGSEVKREQKDKFNTISKALLSLKGIE